MSKPVTKWSVLPGKPLSSLLWEGTPPDGQDYYPRLLGMRGDFNIITSKIVKVDNREVTTRSGSVYLLEGEPDAHFKEQLVWHKITYSEESPLAELFEKMNL